MNGFDDKNDLVLRHNLLTRVLQIVAFLAAVLGAIRLFYPNPLMLSIDIIFVIVSLIGLYYLKKSISNTPIITNIILAIFFILVSIMFTNYAQYTLGPSWFIILIIFAFYQAGIRTGMIISHASFLAIIFIAQNIENPYTLEQYIYTFMPLLVAFIITYLYEQKVQNKEKLLYSKNLEQMQILEEKEELLQQAHYDNLTKLPNRVLFQDRLEQAIVKTNRSHKDFAVLFIDLDKFKEINDTYGHNIGDAVLCEIASRLQSTLRQEDTVSRFGGDEFLCIVEQLESCKPVEILAKKLIEMTKRPIIVENKTLSLTCSVGISIYKKDAKNKKDLIQHADIAMYKAKDLGKDNYQFYTPC